jgi:hypothetical protein
MIESWEIWREVRRIEEDRTEDRFGNDRSEEYNL